MNLKNKVISLATTLILGVGSVAVANAAVPVDLKHPMAVMANLLQADTPPKASPKKTTTSNELVTITPVESSTETKAEKTTNNPDTTSNEVTAHYVYMEQMAQQMNEHIADTNGMMQNMSKHMSDSKHMDKMNTHMNGENLSGTGMQTNMPDDMNRHMGDSGKHMSGMGSHMGM